ncbi:MAG: SDR family NAD(P)-dependent oxidoreductase [Oscillatoriales cyanobacterium]|nr:MAG: SDR family NAD(P)-dependent oxidoreductase [Oscillatoriales cyanobacterium]
MQVCLVTGGNSGVGLMTSLGLAKLGHHVFIACRSQEKATTAIAYIRETTGNPNIEYLPLNLASLESVRHCVKLFQDRNLPLHILVNNAGIFDARGMTQEGFELIWGTNYLGHFLMTYLLLYKIPDSAPSRVIFVSSDLALKPTQIKWDLFVKKTPLNFIELYNQSKLCLLLLTRQLAQKLTNVTVNAVHPGFVQSNITIGHRLSKYLGLGISPEKGAYSSLLCANSPEFESITGKFLGRTGQEIKLPVLAQNNDLCRELWEKSLLWTGCTQAVQKERNNYDASDEIWGPYELNLNQDELATICDRIFQEVLPKPPVKVLLTQALRAFLRFQFGSIVLLLVQCYKGQFYMERHLDSAAVLHLCQDENLLKILTAYLGDNLKLWRSELWANYPSRQLIPFWHRDIYPNLLSTETNGFEYISKSEVEKCQVKITDPFSGNHFFRVPKEVEEKAIAVVLKPGEFILFTDRLVHRSIYNRSGKVRLSLTLRVAQPSIKVLPGYTSNYQKPVTMGKSSVDL